MAVTEQRSGPSVICSHVDIVYRVFGAKSDEEIDESQRPGFFKKLLKGTDGHVGAIREVHAVKDVSFIAHHGESIGIVGRNGSGKSTLLKAVAGLIPPHNGRIFTSDDPALLGVNAVLMPQLTGERNVMIGGIALGLSPDEVKARYDDIVDFADLRGSMGLPMRAYSSGMGARLRFAISTAAVPDILMIDEALATGDAHFKAKSHRRIEEIREQAGTIFLVSHSNNTIRSTCDRVLWMDQGRLIMDGPTEAVMAEYEKSQPKKAKKAAVKKKA